MNRVTSQAVGEYLDEVLGVPSHPDYAQAMNGLQLANEEAVTKIGAAVDLSLQTIDAAVESATNFLIVHHGMFWGGSQRLIGSRYLRIRRLIRHDIAVYSVHLPLDAHAEFGNAALLARALGLNPQGGFARYADVHVGVQGEAQMPTSRLFETVRDFAAGHQSVVRATPIDAARQTRRWGICTGAGASSETLREAAEQRIDTLIVGEGPHHTAIEARELGITVIYAGHYATETLGVQAAAAQASKVFGIPWHFIAAPTGL